MNRLRSIHDFKHKSIKDKHLTLIENLILRMPNTIAHDVPHGKDERDNEICKITNDVLNFGT